MPPKVKRQSRAKASKTINVTDLPRRRSASFLTVYSNQANLGAGLYDVAIIFSEVVAGFKEEPFVEEKCRVVMNPTHAKAFLLALSRNLERWEARFGPINLPSSIVEDVKSSDATGILSEGR